MSGKFIPSDVLAKVAFHETDHELPLSAALNRSDGEWLQRLDYRRGQSNLESREPDFTIIKANVRDRVLGEFASIARYERLYRHREITPVFVADEKQPVLVPTVREVLVEALGILPKFVSADHNCETMQVLARDLWHWVRDRACRVDGGVRFTALDNQVIVQLPDAPRVQPDLNTGQLLF